MKSRNFQRAVVVPEEFKPEGSETEKWRQNLVVSHLYIESYVTDERRRKGHWIGVSSDKLKKLAGNDYKATIKLLVKNAIIEENSSYSVKRFPKSYRLSKRVRMSSPIRVEIKSQVPLKRHLSTFAPNEKNLGETGIWLLERLNDFDICNSFFNNDVIAQRCPVPLLEIELGQIRASRCQFASRFHSTFTRLSSQVRPYIHTSSREPLASVDVAACQPLLLAALVAANVTSPNKIGRQLSIERSAYEQSPDLLKWVKLAESGRFYPRIFRGIKESPEPIMRKGRNGKNFDVRNVRNLAYIKKCVLITLFCDNEAMLEDPFFKFMKREFPTIANFCEAVKNQQIEWRGKNLNHNILACLLQRLESLLIIDGVVTELRQSQPEMPVFTIHDGIYAESSNITAIESLIKQHFASLGLKPLIKNEKIQPRFLSKQESRVNSAEEGHLCLYCKQIFERKRRTKKYCSDSCRNANFKAKQRHKNVSDGLRHEKRDPRNYRTDGDELNRQLNRYKNIEAESQRINQLGSGNQEFALETATAVRQVKRSLPLDSSNRPRPRSKPRPNTRGVSNGHEKEESDSALTSHPRRKRERPYNALCGVQNKHSPKPRRTRSRYSAKKHGLATWDEFD